MAATMLGSTAINDFDGVSLDLLIRHGFRPVPIARTWMLTPDVLGIELSPAQAHSALAPGSHLEVAIPLPEGPAIRHYSLVDGDEDRTRIAILRDDGGRGGSSWLHENLGACSSMLIRGPHDTFGYDGMGPVFFVAGGIGITPITAMIAAAAETGIDWHLLYVGRRRESMAFAEALVNDHGFDHVTVHTTEDAGRPDLVSCARRFADEHGGSASVYTCGPTPLMRDLDAGFAEDPSITVISEDFDSDDVEPAVPHEDAGPSAPSSAGQATSASGTASSPTDQSGPRAAGDNASFLVELTDGSEVTVPRGCSIIEALGNAGIRTLSSCQKGTCGTCESVIIGGAADHRDSVLSAEEHAAQETMMICVSRARGNRITLDL